MRQAYWLFLAVGLLLSAMITSRTMAQVTQGTISSMEMMYQVVLSEQGYEGPSQNGFWWTPTDRGYYGAYAGLIPQDRTQGARLVGWDVSVDWAVTLVPDLNVLCGVEAKAGVPGHQIGAMVTQDERQRGHTLLLGTAAINGPGLDATQFPGGRILRFALESKIFENLAGLEPGWSVVRIRQQGLKEVVVLAGHADAKRYRLYRWVEDQLVYLNVEAGAELLGYCAPNNKTVVYADKTGRVLELPLDKPEPVQPQPFSPKQGQDDSTLAGLQARCRSDVQWLAEDEPTASGRFYLQTDLRWGVEKTTGKLIGLRWLRETAPHYESFKQEENPFGPAWSERCYAQYVFLQATTRATNSLRKSAPQIFNQFPWREGEIYATAPGPDGTVHLQRYRPATQQVTDLGPILTQDRNPVDRVHQLQIDMAGNLLVLASQGSRVLGVLYKNPGMDDLTRDNHRAFKELFKDEFPTPVRFQTVASMHAASHPQDRNWDPLITDSQGNVHYGAMPHHPTLGSKIWKLDTKTGQVEVLGDIDDIAGNTGPNRVPNMIHMFPVEMDGKLYYTGQDPFYKQRQFLSYNDQTHYVGSPLVSYDLHTGQFEYLGIPLPELTIFGLLPAFTKNLLYVQQNYYDPIWHVFDLKTRQIRKINLPPIHKHQHVDSKGLLYFTDPATGNVMRYDPDTDQVTPFAQLPADAFEGLAWNGKKPHTFAVDWLPSTLGQTVAYGFMDWCEAVLQLDTQAGTVKIVGRMRPEIHEFPAAKEGNSQWGSTAHNGKRWFAVQNLQTTGMMHSILFSMDLTTGQSTRHGLMVDEQGRIVRETNAMTFGGDGQIYFNGPVYNLPGDRYWSRRFSWSNGILVDTILGRIVEPKP